MRLWSIHPKYLDSKGLVALWREALLAKHVLENRTRGYKQHPQLKRFKQYPDPINAIHYYLCKVHEEAAGRNYKFDNTKVNWHCKPCTIEVNQGQLEFEILHLKNKLQQRDPEAFEKLNKIIAIELHPMFRLREGGIESWEITDVL